MLGIRLNNKQKREAKTEGVEDVVEALNYFKILLAGHFARMENNRWTARITELRPRNYKTPQDHQHVGHFMW